MKYRDPVTREFKELYTKAADTLPVGTVVDFDGDEVPAGWEEVEPLLKVISIQTSIATIEANSNLFDQTLDITASIPDGYTALGIVGVMMYGAGYANTAFNRKALENNIIKYGIKNTSSNALTTLTANFKVLCIKNED